MARCFNIIDSVKGGSGKSSLALMLSLACSTGYSKTEIDGNPIKSLLLDMDFQGSSFSHLVFGNSELGKNGQAKQYINQKLLQYYRTDNCDYISKPVFKVNDSATSGSEIVKYHQIAAAFASPNIPDRFRFKAVSHHNYSLQITYSTFREGVRRLLDSLDKEMPLGDSLEYVFFDMPPNSNGYSDAVPQLLLNDILGNQKTPPRVNYFELTTLDRGHIESTLQWFEDFVQNSKQRFPDNFFFVLSNTDIESFSDENRYRIRRETIKMIIDRVEKILSNGKDSLRNRIFFIGVFYQADYHEICCTTSFILDESLPLNIVTPISFYQSFLASTLTETNATAWLIQQMRGDA